MPTHSELRKASILTIGDEILMGQITNSNAAWIGDQLTACGYVVSQHSVVGDQSLAIQKELLRLAQENHVVLVTGGLGPTDDDLTLDAVATALQAPLHEDPQWLRTMETYFERRGRTMSSNNRKQARIPQGAIRIDNDCGTAPGIWFFPAANRAAIALMPGVPFEMQSMMKRFVLSELKKLNSTQVIFQKTLLTAGTGESQMAQELGDVKNLMSKGVTLAWLPSLGEVRLRITSIGPSIDEAQKKAEPLISTLKAKFANILYQEDEGSLEGTVGAILTKKGESIAVAESCTGGLINHKLTNVPGSSVYLKGGIVTYSNEVKTQELGVSADLFDTVGAVSDKVARAMAEGVRKKFAADLGIGVTGVAGPDGGTAQNPVGTVWIAVSYGGQTYSKKWVFETDRLRNKERFASTALSFAHHVLTKPAK